MTKDNFLIRAKDVSLLIAILTLMGMFVGPMKKIFQLDDTISKMDKIQDQVNSNKTDIAVVNAQYAQISKQLDQISWQLRRIKN